MKQIIVMLFALLSGSLLHAQQKTGKVVYERVSQMQARFNINGVFFLQLIIQIVNIFCKILKKRRLFFIIYKEICINKRLF